MITFLGTCIHLSPLILDEYDSSEKEISYKTFRKHLGKEIINELNLSFGVPLHKDYAVSFGKGKINGKTAFCLHHSAIHHLWIKE